MPTHLFHSQAALQLHSLCGLSRPVPLTSHTPSIFSPSTTSLLKSPHLRSLNLGHLPPRSPLLHSSDPALADILGGNRPYLPGPTNGPWFPEGWVLGPGHGAPQTRAKYIVNLPLLCTQSPQTVGSEHMPVFRSIRTFVTVTISTYNLYLFSYYFSSS